MHQAPALESHMDTEKFRHFMNFLLLHVLDLDWSLLYPIIKFTHVTQVPQFYQLAILDDTNHWGSQNGCYGFTL